MTEDMLWDGITHDRMNEDDHVVTAAVVEQNLHVSLRLLTTVIAAWRLSIETNSDVPLTTYVMLGLHQSIARPLLGPFGIYEHFRAYVQREILHALEMLRAESEREERYAQLTRAENDTEPTA